MTSERDRVPVSAEYLHALGRATYNFAYLEWGIVWLIETIEPDFLKEVASLTAGQISRRFTNAAMNMNVNDPDKNDLTLLAEAFDLLVVDRNTLVHGNPHTAPGGEQRLLYAGKHGRKDWTINEVLKFADRLAVASVQAGRLLHSGRYAAYLNNNARD